MFNLGPSFLFVVGSFNIRVCFLAISQKLPLTLFELVHLSISFIDLLIGRSHISGMTHSGFVKLLVTHHLFRIHSSRERNTYVLHSYGHNI